MPQYDPRREIAPGPAMESGTIFLKPTKSIKPPVPAAAATPDGAQSAGQLLSEEQKILLNKMASLAEQRATEQRVTAALKRIVVMQSPVSRKPDRPAVLPDGTNGKSVTLVGIDAPKDVVRGLESFFGVQLTPDNEKKLLDTVRKGMAGTSKQERKVEVLGWWPKEGVMAVGVYPEG